MSSIIRKSTQFKPKAQNKPIRKKLGSVTPVPLTPSATQISKDKEGQEQGQEHEGKEQDNGKDEPHNRTAEEPPSSSQPFEDPIITPGITLSTPVSSQLDRTKQQQPPQQQHHQPKPSFSFTIKSKETDATGSKQREKSKSTSEAEEEEIIDPKDSSRKIEIQIPEGREEKKDDDELFKAPVPERERQHSLVPQRRLSGITPIAIRSRSGSIIRSSIVETDGGAGVAAQVPAKISIPIGKPVKRRRSSSIVNRGVSTTKKPSLSLSSATTIAVPRQSISIPVPVPVPGSTDTSVVEQANARESKKEDPESQQLAETNAVADKKDTEANLSMYVVGVDPTTRRLRKYLRRGIKLSPEEITEILPQAGTLTTAPEDLITSIHSVKQLPLTKVENKDADLFAEIDFDVSEMTMADLCKPFLPIGKVSSNFDLVNQAEEKIKQRKEERRRAREIARNNRISIEQASGEADVDEVNNREKQNPGLDLDKDEPSSSVAQNLQLKIQGDQITLDQNSTLIDRHHQASHSNLIREESNPFENPITSSSYSKRRHTDKWSGYEVQQFYEALSTFGTDFSLISQLFPHRSRKQIKSKFNLEEKKYPEIIEMALRRKLPGDFDSYCMNINKNIKTLEQYNAELKQVRLQHEQDLATITEERERAMQEDAEASRRREIEIRTGAKTMTRAEKLKELRKNEMIVGSIDDVKKQREDIEI